MKLPRDIGPVHFVGIGGIGMSGIAEVMLNLGYMVQGSDQAESANVKRLRDKGVHVSIGHNAANLTGDTVTGSLGLFQNTLDGTGGAGGTVAVNGGASQSQLTRLSDATPTADTSPDAAGDHGRSKPLGFTCRAAPRPTHPRC